MEIRISVTHCYLEFGGEEHACHLCLIFPYFLRLVVDIGELSLFLFTGGRAKSKYGEV